MDTTITTGDLRQKFLNFFQDRKHLLFPSDTLVPDDESLLFTSAGMNQFKSYFLGEKKDVSRATSCQKCLRTGDLDRVGKTAYHHTFFEMLGNFSFGDYFKKETIGFAWEFLTKILPLEKKQLWFSVYKDDSEAFDIWKKHIGISSDKIVKLGEESNFWPANAPSLGPDGPCGPCSEVFFDRGSDIGCRRSTCNPDCNCGRFVEVWNLVFTQFNRKGKNNLELLPQKNIDTGMGLERMAAVLQNKESNFQIDILAPLVEEVNKLVLKSSRPNVQSALNAIVDHVRAVTFAIADGVYPSNEEKGYVIRKIIRKALHHSRSLDNKEPFLYKLVPLIAKIMENQYPELNQKKDNITKIILAEEEKYFSIIKEGKIRANQVMKELSELKQDVISAEEVFRLYDTYGVNLDLIKTFAKTKGFKVDEEGFDKLLKEQQERSRQKSMFDEDIFKEKDFVLEESTLFVGYQQTESEGNLLRLFLIKDGKYNSKKEVKKLGCAEEGIVLSDITPFYPESGGQLADKGQIQTKEGNFLVEKTFKAGNAILHKGKVMEGFIKQGQAKLSIDKNRRDALARAHTATHLLQAALRQVLGEHVIQQGSLVDEDEFRFDFTHFGKLNVKEREEVQNLVKKFIANQDRVEKNELSLEEAKKEGALAFFKDKYQNKVRVISISSYSKELCGGTHVENTSFIKDFHIESESSISSGIRRIKALVADKACKAREAVRQKENICKRENNNVNIDITQEVRILAEKIKSRSSEVIKDIRGIKFLSYLDQTSTFSPKEQRQVALEVSDILQRELGPLFLFLVINTSGKDIFVCASTKELVSRKINCKDFISLFQKELSLKGGGSPTMTSGVVSERNNDFFIKLREAVNKFLKQ